MPPWNPVFGHLLFLRSKLAQYPPGVVLAVVIKDIYKEHFAHTEMFYLDLWPLVECPSLTVCNAAASTEVDKRLTTKPPLYKAQFDLESGGSQLLSSNGQAWKYCRGLLNPGFAQGYLVTRVKDVVDSVEIFCENLRKRAGEANMFPLEDVVSPLVLDAMMKQSKETWTGNANKATTLLHKPIE
ncbi:hypothetical protein EJ04DRAFT_13720 [Polyplosphaeria fusca]|uniref:Cytochrome P450 n=1 Tax=Polyplosphaeria fusca TaxID=682080 RepID=A0A9P4QUN2_9PLEO|nr:hypothetical protein EJ04DRAFT_13720 [Polyplosphaeria fusca]